jgi:ubiquinone/menaquinone biosynthesis C-methylase UbiE
MPHNDSEGRAANRYNRTGGSLMTMPLEASAYESKDLALAYDDLSEPQFTHGTALLDLLELRAGQRVLDVGCGTGRLAIEALGRVGEAGRVVGVDPAASRIAIASRRRDARLALYIARAEDLSRFAPEEFDVVYLNSVLNWLRDKRRALEEAYRVLRPGGRLGIATTVRERPNQLNTIARLAWKRVRGVGAKGAREGRGVSATDVQALLSWAAFAPRHIDVHTFSSLFRDARHLVDFLRASTYDRLAPRAEVDAASFELAVQEVLSRDYSRSLCPQGIRLERYVLLAIADKPS